MNIDETVIEARKKRDTIAIVSQQIPSAKPIRCAAKYKKQHQYTQKLPSKPLNSIIV